MFVSCADMNCLRKFRLKAAEAEGASLWQKIRYVIAPYLSPLLVFNTMTTIMIIMSTFTVTHCLPKTVSRQF